MDVLIDPLVTVADRCGLIGVTDRRGLHEALGPYEPGTIRHAVSQVARMTKAGQIHSPLGWLITAARRGDPDLFRRPATPTTPPRPPVTDRLEPDAVADAAVRALAAADAAELAALDDWIRTAPHHARIRHLIFDRTEMLHAARLEAWRALQEVS